jgi:hypothetical protein
LAETSTNLCHTLVVSVQNGPNFLLVEQVIHSKAVKLREKGEAMWGEVKRSFLSHLRHEKKLSLYLAINVPDVGAGHRLHRAAAHPNAKAELQVLCPVVENFLVILANFREPLAVHGKEAARHDRRLDGALTRE